MLLPTTALTALAPAVRMPAPTMLLRERVGYGPLTDFQGSVYPSRRYDDTFTQINVDAQGAPQLITPTPPQPRLKRRFSRVRQFP